MKNGIKCPFFLILFLIFHLSSQQNKFNIPGEFISDSTFINMITKAPSIVQTLYASPSGSGSSCTNTSPCSLNTAIDKLDKGYALYLKKGTYDVKSGISIEKSGINKLYILISSAPNEKAIITSSKTGEVPLFEINGSYIIIENLTFKDVKGRDVQGISLPDGGQNHIIIRNNVFDSLKTTAVDEDHNANGILLYGENKSGIKQVIIYNNTLTNNVLGYSEAISVAGNCEEIYVIQNTLKDNTNIGIDFYGNAGYCKTKELDQPRKSVAIKNYIEKSVSPYDECAGLYVDGARDIYLAENTVVKSQFGIEVGSEEKNDKYPVKNIIVKNNVMRDNTLVGMRVGGFEEDDTGVVHNCFISGNTISGTHTAVDITKSNNITFYGNKMLDIDKFFVDMEFTSTYIKNIKFTNNTFSGTGKFRLYKTEKLSLDEFIKKYPTNKKQ